MSFLRHARSINPMFSLLFLAGGGRVHRFAPGPIVLMSLDQLFLGGSVSTGARLRFTDRFPCSGSRLETSTPTNSVVLGIFRPAFWGFFIRP